MSKLETLIKDRVCRLQLLLGNEAWYGCSFEGALKPHINKVLQNNPEQNMRNETFRFEAKGSASVQEKPAGNAEVNFLKGQGKIRWDCDEQTQTDAQVWKMDAYIEVDIRGSRSFDAWTYV